MPWIGWLGLASGALTAAMVGLGVYGARRWAHATSKLLSRLEGTRRPATTSRYDARELQGLPAPVQRYFRLVLRDGQPIIAAATVEHIGSFNLSSTAEQWKPFTSRQRVVTRRPGFLWNARIVMAPGIAVYVHDAYVGGEGILNPAVLGLYSLAGKVGADDLARGEFMRFFAEAGWYPTALLPSQGVLWEAAEDYSANAILTDGQLSVTMRVNFGESGLIDTVRFAARNALAGNAVVPTPWEGRLSNYQERDGMLIPLTCEAAWLRPQGRAPYWRGTITSSAYEFAQP
jgi:hypothetical protein